MSPDAIESTLAHRFQLEHAPTLVARRDSRAPIVFTRLRSTYAMRGRSLSVPREEAFAFQVPLSLPFWSESWIAGKFRPLPAASPGDMFLFDLRDNPRVGLETPFDTVRFYMPQAALDELAYDRGLRRVEGLRTRSVGAPDRVMHGLAQALIAVMEQDGSPAALLCDYIALAFHAHVVHTYGSIPAAGRSKRGGLAPWQLRRAHEFIEANLDGDPAMSRLALECGLSSSHFARAFKQTMGVPPHRWLTKRRIERAKQLLQETGWELADIAVACGFVDQSHFTRVFSRSEGYGPGKWRRLRQG